ncbi:MAG: magnesium transporter, partial [Flavobacteriaceae bacterium]|nr:magnesium transporter [Flavobacteriaceae bacterium]
MTPFKLSEELIDEIKQLIETGSDKKLKKLFDEYHFADIAEIINEIDTIEAGTYIIKLLDSELTSEVLTELEEDLREGILSNLTAKEIAIEIAELDTDDAADIVAELPKNMLKK